MAFELPALPYAFDALEPHIDKLTMEIHHGKHHQAYITNLNKEITGTEMEKQTIEEICKNASKTSMAVRNNKTSKRNTRLAERLSNETMHY